MKGTRVTPISTAPAAHHPQETHQRRQKTREQGKDGGERGW
jgi:hypothetical protein